MTDPRHRKSSCSRRAGFTLVELLVVIGIITLLVSILLPVIGRVQIQAQSAKTQATIAAIAGAMERYFLDDKSYPGAFPNAQFAATGVNVTFTNPPPGAATSLTMTEAATAALVGGLEPHATLPALQPPTCELLPSAAKYSIGKGPMGFSTSVVNRTRRAPYIDVAPGSNLPQLPFSATGCAATSVNLAGTPPALPDSGFPEFVDSYADPRPIIYIRANAGATGIASPIATKAPSPLKQYTTYEFNYYMRGASGDFLGDFQFSTTDPDRYGTLDEYLRHPNVQTEPRAKDKFILVSSGPDRTFGTRDDIFFGGSK
jgi:prepilin-type N-terminal cleavage/methylation domain-containing protein